MTSGPVVWACLSCISYLAGGAAFWLPWSDPGDRGPGAPRPCTTPLELFYGTGALISGLGSLFHGQARHQVKRQDFALVRVRPLQRPCGKTKEPAWNVMGDRFQAGLHRGNRCGDPKGYAFPKKLSKSRFAAVSGLLPWSTAAPFPAGGAPLPARRSAACRACVRHRIRARRRRAGPGEQRQPPQRVRQRDGLRSRRDRGR